MDIATVWQNLASTRLDLAPKFYPVLSSFLGLDLPCRAGDAVDDCAELFA